MFILIRYLWIILACGLRFLKPVYRKLASEKLDKERESKYFASLYFETRLQIESILLDMITRSLITTFVLLYTCQLVISLHDGKGEKCANLFMEDLDRNKSLQSNRLALVSWDYASNITKENLDKKLKVTAEVAQEVKEQWKEIISFPWQTYQDPDLRRKFEKYSILGWAALPDDKFERLSKITSEMQSIYSTAKICSFKYYNKCDLSLEPDLENILIHSDNEEELKYVWKNWRDASGKKVRKLFQEYVQLTNEAAVLNNFTDNSEAWLKDYEDPAIRDEIKKLWLQLRPLYLQIHAYVRHQLRLKYGSEIVSDKGTIPAHLLGNMWSQTWSNVYKYMTPYPGDKGEDVSEEMVKQNYTPLKIFKTAEKFFTSLNLSAMPDSFWENSILEKPSDGRELICHASAWDFYDQKDFRIKQCTRVNEIDLATAHHEMGHIQYFLQYKNQPICYKRGANPGFHEAIGDVMSLSVSTNKHLHKIGLLKNYEENPRVALNKLFEIGLSKIVFLPFAYIMDLWRWDVFKGKITPENYNSEWWKLRQEYQGVHAPVPRSEEDFDPGAKYHVVASVPYIRYFVSFVIQFQFHKALCEKAGQYEPGNPEKALHLCDIYESKEAGNALAKMLQMGSSKPWCEAMQTLTGCGSMNAGPLLEYFRPLHEWLEKENKKNNQFIGWTAN